MKNEKETVGEIYVKKGKFLTWLENYWYHYKWVTILVAFFLIVFLICTLQVCTKKKSDILITYAGPISMKADEKLALQNAFGSVLPEGFSNKDEAVAGISAYYVLSKEQIEVLEKETDSEGYPIYVDKAFNSSEMDSLETQLQTGSGSVLLLDKDIYYSFFGTDGTSNRLTTLESSLGTKPENAMDNYGIRLGDTAFYQNNPQLSFLSPDTVVCLHAKILGQKNYEKEISAFKAIIAPANSNN